MWPWGCGGKDAPLINLVTYTGGRYATSNPPDASGSRSLSPWTSLRKWDCEGGTCRSGGFQVPSESDGDLETYRETCHFLYRDCSGPEQHSLRSRGCSYLCIVSTEVTERSHHSSWPRVSHAMENPPRLGLSSSSVDLPFYTVVPVLFTNSL